MRWQIFVRVIKIKNCEMQLLDCLDLLLRELNIVIVCGLSLVIATYSMP